MNCKCTFDQVSGRVIGICGAHYQLLREHDEMMKKDKDYYGKWKDFITMETKNEKLIENKYLDSEAILLRYVIRDNNYDPPREYKISLKSEISSLLGIPPYTQDPHAIAIYQAVYQSKHYTVYEFKGIRII